MSPLIGVVLAFLLADDAGGAAALAGVFAGAFKIAQAAFGVLFGRRGAFSYFFGADV
jgi:hypothetical protein